MCYGAGLIVNQITSRRVAQTYWASGTGPPSAEEVPPYPVKPPFLFP